MQLRYNMPIEIFYTIVPLILVLGFFAFTAKTQNNIETPPTAAPQVKIDVYGQRWAWTFDYMNEKVYSPGIQAQTEANTGALTQPLNTLYLPVNKRVEIKILSRDVAHSFWIVNFLYKKDMIPGKANYMYFIPEKIGTYQGKCAELCGQYHSLMLFQVKVVSDADYQSVHHRAAQDPPGPARRQLQREHEPAGHRRTEGLSTMTATVSYTRSRAPGRRRPARRPPARATSSSAGSPPPTTRPSGTCT